MAKASSIGDAQYIASLAGNNGNIFTIVGSAEKTTKKNACAKCLKGGECGVLGGKIYIYICIYALVAYVV